MQHRVPLAVGLDVFIVVLFVAIGRRNHDESPGIGGLIETAAPFLIGLAVAWLVLRAWHDPLAPLTGAGIWVGTVTLGMLVRRVVFDEGTALSFVIVASVFLGVLLNIWRLAARRLAT